MYFEPRQTSGNQKSRHSIPAMTCTWNAIMTSIMSGESQETCIIHLFQISTMNVLVPNKAY